MTMPTNHRCSCWPPIAVVKDGVLALGAHHKVSRTVVVAYFVLVVHFFAGPQTAAMGSFPHHPVFRHVAFGIRPRIGRHEQQDVSAIVNATAAPPITLWAFAPTHMVTMNVFGLDGERVAATTQAFSIHGPQHTSPKEAHQ